MQVDTPIPADLVWSERVSRSAETALSDFNQLQRRWDFIAEGRQAFAAEFEKWEAEGGNPATAMCFVWYVATRQGDAAFPGPDIS